MKKTDSAEMELFIPNPDHRHNCLDIVKFWDCVLFPGHSELSKYLQDQRMFRC